VLIPTLNMTLGAHPCGLEAIATVSSDPSRPVGLSERFPSLDTTRSLTSVGMHAICLVSHRTAFENKGGKLRRRIEVIGH
jgi:hypothetical protein